MKRIPHFFLFLFLVPIFSYAEIDGTLEKFKESTFFIKYRFSQDAKPYTVNERSFIDFYQKETLDRISLEFDSNYNKIIQQIAYLKERDEMDQFVIDFVSEASSGTITRPDLEDILTKFQQKYSGDPSPLGNIFQNLGTKQIGKYNVEIERSIIMEYIVKVESIEQYQKREQRKEELEQKLLKKDAESFILKGLIIQRERFMDPMGENWERILSDSILLFETAVAISPADADANLLLAKSYLLVKEYPKTIETLEAYLKLKPDDKYAHYYLGKAYYEEKNYQKAEHVAKNGLDLIGETKEHVDMDRYKYYEWSAWDESPHETVYYAMNYLYGKCLKELGRYSEAITSYRKVLDGKSSKLWNGFDADMVQELGVIYWLNNEKEKAKELLNELRTVRYFQYADKLEAIMQNKN